VVVVLPGALWTSWLPRFHHLSLEQGVLGMSGNFESQRAGLALPRRACGQVFSSVGF
jgi:hypothetical protein